MERPREAGGEYLWRVKANQPTRRAAIAERFTADPRAVEGGHVRHDCRTARQVVKGHGRREVRRLTVSSELQGYSDWPGLEQVFRRVLASFMAGLAPGSFPAGKLADRLRNPIAAYGVAELLNRHIEYFRSLPRAGPPVLDAHSRDLQQVLR